MINRIICAALGHEYIYNNPHYTRTQREHISFKFQGKRYEVDKCSRCKEIILFNLPLTVGEQWEDSE